MSILKASLLAALALATAATIAQAHDTAPIDRTQAAQMREIQDARRTGALTRREYEGLVSEQARIADMERRAQANGVTGREFREIRQAQRNAGAHIADDTQNGRVNIWRRIKTRHER